MKTAIISEHLILEIGLRDQLTIRQTIRHHLGQPHPERRDYDMEFTPEETARLRAFLNGEEE